MQPPGERRCSYAYGRRHYRRTAAAKLRAMVRAAALLRARHG